MIADSEHQSGAITGSEVQVSQPGEAVSAEMLRQVAHEVRSSFPRPPGTPELVLIDVDPRRLHAFWTIPPAVLDAARMELGRQAEIAPTVLRIHQVSPTGAPGNSFDVEIVGLQGQCYVDIWGEARRYSGEVGLRRSDGRLVSLASSTPVELPRLGPVGAPPLSTEPRQHGTEPKSSPSSHAPTRHPFPQPPSERPPFVPAHSAETANAIGSVSTDGLAGDERAKEQPAQPAPRRQDLSEPVRHPVPLPPGEPSEFDPGALVGGFLAPAEAGHQTSLSPAPGEAQTQPTGETSTTPSPTPEFAAEADSETSAPLALPLENVLTLSSYALGRETVEFEVNAELHVFGRARPGTQLQLFGRKVPLRPDGTFSLTRPLPSGALVLSSLLVGDDDPRESE